MKECKVCHQEEDADKMTTIGNGFDICTKCYDLVVGDSDEEAIKKRLEEFNKTLSKAIKEK